MLVFRRWLIEYNIKNENKMNTMKILRNIIMLLAVFSFASSCDDPDGKWDPMVWKAEVPVQTTDGIYNVSEAGSEFTFSCRYYSTGNQGCLKCGSYYIGSRVSCCKLANLR